LQRRFNGFTKFESGDVLLHLMVQSFAKVKVEIVESAVTLGEVLLLALTLLLRLGLLLLDLLDFTLDYLI